LATSHQEATNKINYPTPASLQEALNSMLSNTNPFLQAAVMNSPLHLLSLCHLLPTISLTLQHQPEFSLLQFLWQKRRHLKETCQKMQLAKQNIMIGC
jgi:hypothetical protein